MDEQVVTRKKRWWRYLRLSMRGLIVLVLLTGGGLGWLIRAARIQREAVAALEKCGCAATYDWQVNDGKPVPGGRPWAPHWLVDRLGVDYFGHVTDVTVIHSMGDGPKAAIAPICRLTGVQGIHVFAPPFGDAELAGLRGLRSLSVLNLGGSHVSDTGLAHLKGLTNLSIMSLCNTKITDRGLAHLDGLTKLSYLDIGAMKISDDGLANLKHRTGLSFLDLLDTQVTDQGLAHLKPLRNLSFLRLEGTQISDAGLVHLKGSTKLTRLDLRRTRVTAAGINELKQALPGLSINH